MLEFECDPFDTSRGLKDFRRGVHMLMMGDKGIECWSDESDSNANHHLFDLWRPKFPGYNMNLGGDSLRNENGLFVHYTPVLISETSNWNVPNFTNLKHVHPRLGDGKTFMLAVNGPAVFKEVCINLNDWPDYVFDSSYRLPALNEVEDSIRTNRHLPGIRDTLLPFEKHIDTSVFTYKCEEGPCYPMPSFILDTTGYKYHTYTMEWPPH